MSNKVSKTDKLFKVIDKLDSSKLGKVLDVTGNLIQSGADVVNNQLDEHNKRHSDDVRVPDIIDLSLNQTKDLLNDLNIKHDFIVIDPSTKLASQKVDTVIKTVPKANTVLPANGFIKIYYMNNEVLEQSKELLKAVNERKQSRKDSAKSLANKIGQETKSGISGAVEASKKLVPHPKRKKAKKIKATIIEVPKESDDSNE